MLESVFANLFDSAETAQIDVASFLICVGLSLVLGLIIAALYMHKTHYTKGFVVTLTIMPAVVAMVILMVNGSIGAGVAVAGTFSLVRFRSVPGTAKEIGAIFLAMGAGLAMGMGYAGFAVLFVVIVSGINFLLTTSSFGESAQNQRVLIVTMPEDLDYSGVFDDVFTKYTTAAALTRVKTTNMGSLLKITYEVTMAPSVSEKAFIDELRCRNGNLEIVLAKQGNTGAEL
ncbi:DUF4956 domain-containing protein [Bengtsoniella intestinalis]|uniref:DUF4956 domain-containing protein n=1 Tax=Bengtsoniella intestinalis TaxID=3073143 RepID=UPI00391F3E25